jgi:hypothetical protein
VIEGLPYRREPGRDSGPRPQVPLPPGRMPLVRAGRPLKRWRYVGVFCEEAMLCVGAARVGPARQAFWAVWDRRDGRLRERTRLLGRGGVDLSPGRVAVRDAEVDLDVVLEEGEGVETVCAHGGGYIWTRKQGGVSAAGTLALGGRAPRPVTGRAVIDDTAGYHARVTEWWWSAGVGLDRMGTPLAWNLVAGVNDPARLSERTVWVAGRPREAPAVRFSDDLSLITGAAGTELGFVAEAQRSRRENLLVLRSDYRQPFGVYGGTLPDGSELAHGLGVAEHHRARW